MANSPNNFSQKMNNSERNGATSRNDYLFCGKYTVQNRGRLRSRKNGSEEGSTLFWTLEVGRVRCSGLLQIDISNQIKLHLIKQSKVNQKSSSFLLANIIS